MPGPNQKVPVGAGRFLLALVLYSLLWTVDGQPQLAKTYTVRGQIFSLLDGQPMAGIRVYLKGTHLKAVTDTTGRFAIHRVPPGTYDLVAKYPDFDATILQGIEVPPKTRKSFVFNLQPEEPVEPLPLITEAMAESLGVLEGKVKVKIDTFSTRLEKGWLVMKAVVAGNIIESYVYPRQWHILPVKEQEFRFKFPLPLGHTYHLYLIWQEEYLGSLRERILDVARQTGAPQRVRDFDLQHQKKISGILIELNARKISQ